MGKVCFSVTSILLHLLFTGNLFSPLGQFLLIFQHPIQVIPSVLSAGILQRDPNRDIFDIRTHCLDFYMQKLVWKETKTNP